MKNKLYYVLLGFLISFSYVGKVFAFEFTVAGYVSNAEVVAGEEATVNVFLKSESPIAGCLFKVEADNSIELVSKTGMNGWNIALEGTEGINVENSSLSNDPLTNGKNILSLKYKVNGAGKVIIKTDHCVSTLTEEKSTHSDIVVNFATKDLSADTNLSNLLISGAQLVNFSPTEYTYSAALSKPNFSLTMTASNPDYQDDIVVTDVDGNVLDPNNITFSDSSGQSVMMINITVNGDTAKAYKLLLGYEQKGLDNSLSSLKVNGKVIELEAGKFSYALTVPKDVTSFKVEAVLSDSENFQFVTGNAPGDYAMGSGTTSVALIVEPKSSQTGGKVVTYIIDVTKEGGSSSSKPSTSKPSSSIQNPQTGGISMFVMAFILIASLVSSVFLYQKNLESYK